MEQLSQARRRLVFEEFFLYTTGLSLLRIRRDQESHYPCPKPIPQSFYDRLDFPSPAHNSGPWRRSPQISSGRPMSRLLQGDVGSGKTMVALGAMLQAVENGLQAALMAPTELLANQHYQTISAFLEPLGVSCVLITGSMSRAQRRRVLDYVAVGRQDCGRHSCAVYQYHRLYNLGLVVIDEQHRFGVRQRAALAAKGSTPHMLVLSATPIPRTLALILYGDLDVSLIDELPPGRQTVDTFLVTTAYHARIWGFVRKHVQSGRQVYVVCPAVEENEGTDLTAAETMYQQLQGIFPDLRIGLVHGKLRSEAKEHAMEAFLKHDTDILVATTVIEVGVDVRNATLMIVEDADRFGLSQLHQLRGRVGRNSEKSYCILISDNQNPDTRKRLQAMCQTNDGFAIAQQDLEQRGPGDFFGHRQSGLPMFQSASLAQDLSVLKEAQEAADTFLSSDPDPQAPENSALFARVQALFAQSDDTFN